MPYTLVDSFGCALGGAHTSLDAAQDAVEEMGEAAGEVAIVETAASTSDGAEIAKADILNRWTYDFVHETFNRAK